MHSLCAVVSLADWFYRYVCWSLVDTVWAGSLFSDTAPLQLKNQIIKASLFHYCSATFDGIKSSKTSSGPNGDETNVCVRILLVFVEVGVG